MLGFSAPIQYNFDSTWLSNFLNKKQIEGNSELLVLFEYINIDTINYPKRTSYSRHQTLAFITFPQVCTLAEMFDSGSPLPSAMQQNCQYENSDTKRPAWKIKRKPSGFYKFQNR